MSGQALSHINILDLSHHVAGPYCTKLLAELGAEVVKVERPVPGDPARKKGPFPGDMPHQEKSALFLYLNTNKKSITLNLKSETGRRIFHELLQETDALVENFKPSAMPNLRLDYETLSKVKPELVMTSISNFGKDGPYRDYKAAEVVEYALGGLMYTFGSPHREPLKAWGTQAQYLAGTNAAFATLVALHSRDLLGSGQHVDISIQETLLAIIETTALMYAYQGTIRPRADNRDARFGPLVGIYECKDGYISTSILREHQFVSFCEFIGMPELPDDPRFNDWFKVPAHGGDLEKIMTPWFKSQPKEEVFHGAQTRRIPIGPVLGVDELLNNEQFAARKFFIELEHPEAGRVKYPSAAFRMSETPAELRRAPLLGEHNEEIYCGRLGYSKKELVKLKEMGII
ncbi:MAG: CoA transferase [Chloroflexi bacterium]|nr:CoA transferase [Chloroflexota bacterium]